MRVVVCDPGVDDAVALAVLAAAGVEVDLVVATAGNVDVAGASEVAARVVLLLGTGWPVAAARRSRLRHRPPRDGRDLAVHGTDGLGGQLHRLPRAPAPPDLDLSVLASAAVFGCGPLTVVAEGVAAGHRPASLTWMGGRLERGRMTDPAEFNAWCDPAAVEEVLASEVPMCIVPLDVTTTVRLGPADLDRWRGSPLGQALRRAYASRDDRGGPAPHDAVAALAWLEPQLFDWREVALRCEVAGEHRGALVPVHDDDRRPVLTAVACAAAEVRERIVGAVESRGA